MALTVALALSLLLSLLLTLMLALRATFSLDPFESILMAASPSLSLSDEIEFDDSSESVKLICLQVLMVRA